MKTLITIGLSLILGLAYYSSTELQSAEKAPLQNYEKTYTCGSTNIYSPSSIEQVQDIVKAARATGKKVMTGSEKFASQLDAACADKGQIQITMKNLNKVVEINKDDMTVTAQAGLRFFELNNALDLSLIHI